jgi:hypothetical protein
MNIVATDRKSVDSDLRQQKGGSTILISVENTFMQMRLHGRIEETLIYIPERFAFI